MDVVLGGFTGRRGGGGGSTLDTPSMLLQVVVGLHASKSRIRLRLTGISPPAAACLLRLLMRITSVRALMMASIHCSSAVSSSFSSSNSLSCAFISSRMASNDCDSSSSILINTALSSLSKTEERFYLRSGFWGAVVLRFSRRDFIAVIHIGLVRLQPRRLLHSLDRG